MPLFPDGTIPPAKKQETVVLRRSVGASTQSRILAANTERQGLILFNHSLSPLYIDFGASVSLNNFALIIPPGGYYEIPFVTPSEVRGVWEQAQGKALIREFV